jgi:hypothetical protein
MKKKYIAPETCTFNYEIGPLLNVGSITETTSGAKSEGVDDTPYNGSNWNSRQDRNYNAWEDEEEYEDNGGW